MVRVSEFFTNSQNENKDLLPSHSVSSFLYESLNAEEFCFLSLCLMALICGYAMSISCDLQSEGCFLALQLPRACEHTGWRGQLPGASSQSHSLSLKEPSTPIYHKIKFWKDTNTQRSECINHFTNVEKKGGILYSHDSATDS